MATLIHLENQNDCKTATIYDIIEKTELMEVTMSIYESGQMYLETIYILSQKKSHVRAIDVGEQMGYSKPSVSRALSILKRDDYVSVDDTGGISLTAKGMEVAKTMYTRHTVLSQLLMRLGVDEKTATEDACKIEHVISEKSFAAIQKYWM
jgi:Mn-dependent DtxR family transcriptional regulator